MTDLTIFVLVSVGWAIMLLMIHLSPSGIRIPRNPNTRRKPKEYVHPEHVSWREIDEPLLYGWEYRFRQSIGPIPDDIEALKRLADEHESYAKLYSRHTNIFDRDMPKSKEHQQESNKFINLYNQEVRKFYLLAPEDPIELPMKYKLPDDGATRLSVNHRLPRKGLSNRVHIA